MLHKFKKAYLKLSKKKKLQMFAIQSLIILILLSLFIIFFRQVSSLVFTLSLVCLGSLSKVYKRFLGFSIGFELVTLSGIIFLYMYGVAFGLMLTWIMLILSTLLSGRFSKSFVLQVGIYGVLSIVSLFFLHLDFMLGAKLLIIMYNILLHSATLFLLGFPVHSSVITLSVHIFSNFVLIELFGKFIIPLL